MTLTAGVGREFQMSARRTPASSNRAEVQQILDLYDRMFDECRNAGWTSPSIAMDRLADYLHPQLVPVVSYERKGMLIQPRSVLGGTLFDVPEGDALAGVRNADFAILTTASSVDERSFHGYPFNLEMQNIESKLIEIAKHDLVFLQTSHTSSGELSLFMRPAVSMQYSAREWILDDGIVLSAPAAVLRARPNIELRGMARFQWPIGTYHDIDLPHVTAKWLDSGEVEGKVEANLSKQGNEYRILVHFDPKGVPEQVLPRLRLVFDRYFISKDLGLNDDPRKLVIPAPDQAILKLP